MLWPSPSPTTPGEEGGPSATGHAQQTGAPPDRCRGLAHLRCPANSPFQEILSNKNMLQYQRIKMLVLHNNKKMGTGSHSRLKVSLLQKGRTRETPRRGSFRKGSRRVRALRSSANSASLICKLSRLIFLNPNFDITKLLIPKWLNHEPLFRFNKPHEIPRFEVSSSRFPHE